jgi:membrane protein required for colicin V production
MIWADYAILGIVAVSVVISIVRGFVREALSLAAWIAAIWVALGFSRELAELAAPYISAPSVRVAVAFGALFLVTLLIGALVGHLVVQLVQRTGLTGTDRMVGVVFGMGRGVAIVTLLVLLAGLTSVPKDPWWRESVFVPHFEEAAIWMRAFLPPEVAANFAFD